MKAHSQEFKDKIKELGRELDNKITYELNSETIELGNEELNSIAPHYEGAILKSVMKQLDIDSNVDIPIGTEVNYQLGLKLRSGKNILGLPNGTYSNNGITAIVNNGEIMLSGTASGTSLVQIPLLKIISSTLGTLTKSLNISGTSTGVETSLRKQDGSSAGLWSSNGANISGTLSENAYFFRIQINNGTQVSSVLKPQVELGSQATSYEEYGAYDYLDYGNYIVKESEKQEDTNSYRLTCYDKMLYAMKDYEALTDANDEYITYPITIRNYLIALARRLNLTFKNANDTFVNYDKQIKSERYLTEDGASLNYTYRDVLDELSQATASSICISDDDELEIRYVNQTEGLNWFDINIWNDVNINQGTKELFENGITLYNPNARDVYMTSQYIGTTNYPQSSWKYMYEVEPNTTYYISFDKNSTTLTGSASDSSYLAFIDSSHVYIPPLKPLTSTIGERNVIEFTTPSNCKYISFRFGVRMSAGEITYSNVMISKNNIPYEPYGDTIDEEYLKDVNVKFDKEKFGAINTINLARADNSDIISKSIPSDLADNLKKSITITNNQILNDDDRGDYIDGILNQLNGLEYYINDYSSTGVCYYDFLDKYNVKVDNKFYNCIMLNDEINIEQGITETIHAEAMEQLDVDYTKTTKTDKIELKTSLIVNKQQGQIESVVGRTTTLEGDYDDLETQIGLLGSRVSQTEAGVQIATSVQQTIINGVPLVRTGIVVINDEGIDVGTTASKVHTKMRNNEFVVGSEDSDEKLAFIGYDESDNTSKAEMDNLYVRKWFVSGSHRREKFEINNKMRTGEFYNE